MERGHEEGNFTIESNVKEIHEVDSERKDELKDMINNSIIKNTGPNMN